MGREVKRVPLDFDWPIGKGWPGYHKGICSETIEYCLGSTDAALEVLCDACKHFAHLAGLSMASHGCPDTQIHPPKGDAWQLWETVSEGSPVSPVFATAEELATWLAEPGNDTSVTAGTSKEEWLQFLNRHTWAPSLIGSPQTGLIDGVRGMLKLEEADAAPPDKPTH